MVAIAGVVIGSTIVPTDTSDTFPTHNPTYGLGGVRTVADHAARNAIPNARCLEGMVVYTINDGFYWRLKTGFSNPTIDPDWQQIIPDLPVSIANGGTGQITQAAAYSALFPITAQVGDEDFLPNSGFITSSAVLLVFTLPAVCSVGQIIKIVGMSVGGWQIAQNANQTIHFGDLDTTTGVTGTLSSTSRYDCVELVCTVANLDFVVASSVGNIAIA